MKNSTEEGKGKNMLSVSRQKDGEKIDAVLFASVSTEEA